MLRLKHERYLLQKGISDGRAGTSNADSSKTSSSPGCSSAVAANQVTIDKSKTINSAIEDMDTGILMPDQVQTDPDVSATSDSDIEILEVVPSTSHSFVSRSSSSSLPSNPDAPTFCVVCGGHAHCYYYGAPSCNSCKTFFRRAVNAKRVRPCPKEGKCRIEHGLMLCRECRFEKCLQVGMNPRADYAREDLQLFHKLFLGSCALADVTERVNNAPKPTCTTNGNASKIKIAAVGSPLSSYEIAQKLQFELKLKEMKQVEQKLSRLRTAEMFPLNLGIATVKGLLAEPPAINYVDSYKQISLWHRWPEKIPPINLVFLYIQGKKLWTYVEAILAVEFFKPMCTFQRLSHEDQTALVRGAVHNVMFFSMSYDAYKRGHRESVVYPDGNTPLQYFLPDEGFVDTTGAYDYESLCKQVKRGIVPYLAEAKITEEEALLLKMILALNAETPDFSEETRERILKERVMYVKALIRVSKCDFTTTQEGWNRFHKLYDLVRHVIDLSMAYKMISRYLSADFFQQSSLFVELFL